MKNVKIKKEYPDGGVETGYMNEKNQFVLHSFNDEPSVIYEDGEKIWHKDGLFHREGNKPARIFTNGYKHWYKNGKEYYPELKLPEYTMDKLKELLGHDFKLIIDVK